MIDREHELPLVRQAELLELSRSSLYYKGRPVTAATLAIMRRIDELHLEYPFAGPGVSLASAKADRNAGQSDAARSAAGRGREDRAGTRHAADAAYGRRRDLLPAQYVKT